MSAHALPRTALSLVIDPDTLGFADTTELLEETVPWIGQERAQEAARFGLTMEQPDYNLFVLGEVGSGRSTLLVQLVNAIAATRAVPADLCYLHNFDVPERPRALRMPPGQGRELRQHMVALCQTLQREIPLRLSGETFKAESERIRASYKGSEAKAYETLDAFAEARHFVLYRESGHLVFTLTGEDGKALTETEARALPKERRLEMERDEQALRAEIDRFLEVVRPLERTMMESLVTLRRQLVKPLLEREMQEIRVGLKKQIKDSFKLGAYLDQVQHDVLEHLELFTTQEDEEIESTRREALQSVLQRYTVNLVVDNSGRTGAPVIVEQNPVVRALFGGIDYQAEEDVMVTDYTRIRAGSLLKAHGGFLVLHLRDLLADELVWEKLRRFLRSGRVQIEEPAAAVMPLASVAMVPEAVDADVKLVLIGSVEQYYELQEADPEFARRFRVKVDFAESIAATDETRHGTAVLVAHTCRRLGLSHFSSAAVAAVIEQSHRAVDDQTRQSAVFAQTEALVVESASQCSQRGAALVQPADVAAALQARRLRHDYPEQRLRESIAQGDCIISLQGMQVGQVNGLTQIDLGDWRFGLPVRLTARTFAGTQGVLNIEREVSMSGPIHDKGVFILQTYLRALFAHLAPLALSASVVFEQEYMGVEGDSASCAELYALLSALSGMPLRQGIAVTGAVNQHGEVLPVGGLNEKIEGWFRVCAAQGLDGEQGVLIPRRNARHLMLDASVRDAVDQGLFTVYTADHVRDGIELLTGFASGLELSVEVGPFDPDTVLGRAQERLQEYRRACQSAVRHHRRLRRE
ncbi:AAA family ATPase [Curvibacter sp. APW13]|uniref:Lon protease family protein n=1 Tax=Curvibacter sp. APW13 TaxID=3077236 RepID=UPI0028DF2D5C|nr:AAA family ATPase [Curvibacter sp. APW13]MDT8990513.1 AAA family ATPase [Curvibacter sp. APW13]